MCKRKMINHLKAIENLINFRSIYLWDSQVQIHRNPETGITYKVFDSRNLSEVQDELELALEILNSQFIEEVL